MTDIDKTLEERGNRYGAFPGHARITQDIKRAMHASPRWPDLTDDKREALEMIAHKIGRILNGDPDYLDSWHDIIGYTKPVEDEIGARSRADNQKSQPQVRTRPKKSARSYPHLIPVYYNRTYI